MQVVSTKERWKYISYNILPVSKKRKRKYKIQHDPRNSCGKTKRINFDQYIVYNKLGT